MLYFRVTSCPDVLNASQNKVTETVTDALWSIETKLDLNCEGQTDSCPNRIGTPGGTRTPDNQVRSLVL